MIVEWWQLVAGGVLAGALGFFLGACFGASFIVCGWMEDAVKKEFGEDDDENE